MTFPPLSPPYEVYKSRWLTFFSSSSPFRGERRKAGTRAFSPPLLLPFPPKMIEFFFFFFFDGRSRLASFFPFSLPNRAAEEYVKQRFFPSPCAQEEVLYDPFASAIRYWGNYYSKQSLPFFLSLQIKELELARSLGCSWKKRENLPGRGSFFFSFAGGKKE